MAVLEDLPAPLPLQIMKNVADIKSLDALRRSSPLFNLIFTEHAVEVFEHLLLTTLLDDVAVAIRIYVLLTLCKSHLPQTADDIDHLLAQAREPLSRDTPVFAVSLALRETSFLSSACDHVLREKLAYLRSLPHEHPRDRTYKDQYDMSGMDVATTPYHIGDPMPPYWIEEQRSLRGAWIMQISREFEIPDFHRHLCTAGLLSDSWRVDEVEELTASFQALEASESLPLAHSLPISWCKLAVVPPRTSDASSLDLAWQDTLERSVYSAHHRSRGFGYFHRRNLRYSPSPLRHAAWTVMRRLGLGIWSNRRMAEELQLSNFPRELKPPSQGSAYRIGIDDFMSEPFLLFTWWKLYETQLSLQ